MGGQKALFFPPYFAASSYCEFRQAVLRWHFHWSYELPFTPFEVLLLSTYVKDMFPLLEVDNVM